MLAFAALAVVVVGIVRVFSSLTVEVATDELSWHFGPGVWRKTIARAEIVSAVVVTTMVWVGASTSRRADGFTMSRGWRPWKSH